MKSQRTRLSSPDGIAARGSEDSSRAAEPQAYAFGPFRLLPGERILRRNDQVLALPPKAFETLLLLVRNAGHLMRKEYLMTALWPDSFVEEVNLASKISLLRKLLSGGGTGRYIQTVPKQGYRFLAPVIKAWAAGTALGAAGHAEGTSAEAAIRFIALPFRQLNADDRVEYIKYSLPEAISASLAGLRALTVRSSLLAARLAEGWPDARQIAREADVDMLLAGTVLADGDQVRISAELIHAPADKLVGSYVYETRRDNLIEVQDSLLRGIVELLVPRLNDREKRVLAHNVPTSARAYEFYLRGNHVALGRTFESMSMARDFYRECLDEDPNYAPAWARLGRCHRFLEKLGEEGPESLESARWAFHRAFALSPDLPLAHNFYTSIEADSGHAQAAMVRLLEQADKHPNNPELFGGLVQACRYCGLPEESVRAHQRARRLDPKMVTSVAFTYFLLGDYERTIEWYPPGARFYLDLAALAVAERETEAAELLEHRSFPAGKWPEIESLRWCLQGDVARSLAVVRQALVEPLPDPESKFYLARQLARDGEHADALHTLRETATGGYFSSIALSSDPWLRPLAALPEFRGVLDEVLRLELDARAAFQAAGGDRILS